MIFQDQYCAEVNCLTHRKMVFLAGGVAEKLSQNICHSSLKILLFEVVKNVAYVNRLLFCRAKFVQVSVMEAESDR